jgi:phosphatidylglycerophosphatase A
MTVSAESPGPTATRSEAPLWATLIATFFGAGRMKPGPGTWGSAATVILWVIFARWIPPAALTLVTIVAAATVTVIGIPAATRVARASGIKDPQFVVIDEVAGQLVTLIGAALTWQSAVTGLILFRVFDIFKPPPVRQLERLPEGTGIVVDDLAAGLYGLIIMHLLRHFGLLMK